MRRTPASFIRSLILVAFMLAATSGAAGVSQRETPVGLCHVDAATGNVEYLEVPESGVPDHAAHGDTRAPNGPDDCVDTGEPESGESGDPTEVPTRTSEGETRPVAIDDEYTAEIGVPLVVPAPGVLANDRDASSAILVREPSWGTLEFGRDGSFTYIADRDHPGMDIFAYQAIHEEGHIDIGQVHIFLSPKVENPPVAVDDTYTLEGGGPHVVPAPGVLANDYDPEQDPIWVTGMHTGLVKGTCQWFKWTPDGGFTALLESGVTSTWCVVTITSDGVDFVDSLLTINVVPPPGEPVGTWDVYEVALGQTLTVPAAQGLLANDLSPLGNPLAVSIYADLTGVGGLSLNADGSFTFVAPTTQAVPGTNIVATFVYQLTDTVTGVSVSAGVRFDLPI